MVGGHCIGVDPYYLTYKPSELGHHAKVITSGRAVNDGMSEHIASELIKALIKADKNIKHSKVLVMGITFKENVSDIRNSKVADVIYALQEYGIEPDVVDPFADSKEVEEEYGVKLSSEKSGKYDAVILAVSHNEYVELKASDLENMLEDQGIVYDVKGLYRNLKGNYTYLSL